MSYSITWKYKDKTKSFAKHRSKFFDTPEECEKWLENYIPVQEYEELWFNKFYWYIVDSVGVVYKSNDPLEKKEEKV